ncbi:MAG TPA: penicillin-binding protein activator [Nitrospirales bacterium]|nr:penicillin-binding protein activator [Nitrospirales bacterium]
MTTVLVKHLWLRTLLCFFLGGWVSQSDQRLWPFPGGDTNLAFAQQASTFPLLDRAKLELEAENPAAAITTLEELIDSFPPPEILEEAYLLQATALKQDHQPTDALTVLKQLLEEFPFSRTTNPARVLMAELYIGLQDYEPALDQLYQALDYSTDLDQRRSIFQLIRQAELNNHHPLGAVKALLNEMSLADPTERLELEQITQTLILQQLDEPALQELVESYASRYPGDIATIRLIELHTAHGDEVLAERDIRGFLKRFPSHPYAQTAMALLQSFISKIKIHSHILAAALPFSGPMKPYGTDSLNGIRLAIEIAKEQWGLTSVGLVVKDTTTLTAPLRAEIQQWLGEFRPLAVIGPLLSREIEALGQLPDQYVTPFVTPSSTLLNVRQFGSFWFSTAMTSSVQAKRLVEYAILKLGYHRFSIIYPQTAYGREMSDMFAKEVLHSGGEIIASEGYAEDQTDIGAQLRHLKEKDLATYGTIKNEKTRTGENRTVYTPGFDAVFVPGQPVHLALIAAQLAFYDMNVPILGGNSWHNPELFRWAKHDLDGNIFVDGFFPNSPDPNIQMFVQRYRSQFQKEPSLFAFQAYDAATMVMETIRQGAQSGQGVWDQLVRRSDLPALSGFASFSSAGILNRRLYLLQVKNRTFTQLN